MKKVFFVLALLNYTTAALCQDYYVSNNNDTIRGVVVNYKEWSRNPVEVLFKLSSASNSLKLNPSNCKSIVIGSSDRYISYSGTRILNSENISSKAGLHDDDQLRRDSILVFLREIYQYKGYAFYKLSDNKRTNFYLDKNGALKELEYYEYINDANVVIPNNAYKIYIAEQLSGENNTGLDQKIAKLTYNEKSLIDFLAKVLQDDFHVSEKMRNKYPDEFFAGLGMNLNTGRIENSGASANGSYSTTTFSPSFEVGLRIYSQRNFGRSFFQPALNVTSFSHNFHLKDNTEYKMKATVLSGHIAAGYLFQKKSVLSFYGIIGAGMTLVLNYKTSFINGSYSQTIKADKVLNKLTFHPEFGLVIHKSLNVALTGTLPFKLPLYSNFTYAYAISKAGIIIRYLFIKNKK